MQIAVFNVNSELDLYIRFVKCEKLALTLVQRSCILSVESLHPRHEIIFLEYGTFEKKWKFENLYVLLKSLLFEVLV